MKQRQPQHRPPQYRYQRDDGTWHNWTELKHAALIRIDQLNGRRLLYWVRRSLG